MGRLAQVLIAGGAGMPSATEADVQSEWIDRVLAARPDLSDVIRIAASSMDDPQATLEKLAHEDPDGLERLRYAIAAAYLMNPRVRALLGYPGGVPGKQPAYHDEADAYLDGGILDAVIERGPIYRSAPKTK